MNLKKYIIYFYLAAFTIAYGQAEELLNDSTSVIFEEIITSSGSGFLVSDNGHIVTSYHIIDNAKSIKVGVNIGDSIREFDAEIIAEDPENDLAVLKIIPDDIKLKNIPFNISNNDIDLGASVYTLGFPMVETMGKSIKLSNGIISSTSGFMGNDHSYQISVPINPGNSGGPLFDEKGNLVGVIKSIYSGAENVAYAIKSKHVNDLCLKLITTKEINMANTQKVFVQQVKYLKDFVCLVIVTS